MANDTSSEAISRRRLLKTGAAGLALTSAIGTAPRYISVAHAEGEVHMAKVKANGITMNYAQQGTGEPLVLIPYLAADNACYAFQVADYAKHFTCISVDPRGAGETDKPEGTYSMELFADDIAAFMQAIGVERAHVSGLSLGAATGLWVAGKYPQRVKSLSLHSCWPKSDAFLKTVAGGMAKHCQRIEQRHRNDHPGNHTLVLHAGFLLKQSGVHGQGRGFRTQPSETAARRLHEAVERGDRPRCCVSIGAHQSTDPDHLRSTRPSNLNAICRRSDQRNQRQRAFRFRDLRTRSCLPKHSRVQREDFELPETAHRLGTRARRPPTRAIQVVAAE